MIIFARTKGGLWLYWETNSVRKALKVLGKRKKSEPKVTKNTLVVRFGASRICPSKWSHGNFENTFLTRIGRPTIRNLADLVSVKISLRKSVFKNNVFNKNSVFNYKNAQFPTDVASRRPLSPTGLAPFVAYALLRAEAQLFRPFRRG